MNERALTEYIRSLKECFDSIAGATAKIDPLTSQFARDCAAQCDKVAAVSGVALAAIDASKPEARHGLG